VRIFPDISETEYLDRVVSTFLSLSLGPGVECRLGNLLSWQRFCGFPQFLHENAMVAL
jgi:hypothetical protein